MGNLTDDMTRLRGEINSLRQGRRALRQDLSQSIVQLRRNVADSRDAFRQAHAEMASTGQKFRLNFVTDLTRQVTDLLGAVTADLQGARQAWNGSEVTASAGRAKRPIAEVSSAAPPVAVDEPRAAQPEVAAVLPDEALLTQPEPAPSAAAESTAVLKVKPAEQAAEMKDAEPRASGSGKKKTWRGLGKK